MQHERSTIERAFELAREGRCRSIEEIRGKLKAEQYDQIQAHLSGSSIKQQLQTAIVAAARERF